MKRAKRRRYRLKFAEIVAKVLRKHKAQLITSVTQTNALYRRLCESKPL